MKAQKPINSTKRKIDSIAKQVAIATELMKASNLTLAESMDNFMLAVEERLRRIERKVGMKEE